MEHVASWQAWCSWLTAAEDAVGGWQMWVSESIVGRLGDWIEKETSSSENCLLDCCTW